MKKNILFCCVSVFIFFLVSCNPTKKTDTNEVSVEQSGSQATDDFHNARISLDYYGIYEGIIPCADCEGIKVTVTLNKDDTYALRSVYLKDGKELTPTGYKGKYTWDDQGSVITLNGVEGAPSHFFVGEGNLTIVDQNGDEISSELEDYYVLEQKQTF